MAHDQVEANLIYNPSEVADQSFDYVIVGGGTTGLTAAARLTENRNIRVLVIESGYWESERSTEISDLTCYGRYFGSTIDHSFRTTQQDVCGRNIVINSGRGLGGSTLINGGAYTRPCKAQIDSWQAVFGNDGWTWDGLLPYMKKAETVRPPTAQQAGIFQSFDTTYHGTDGPVQVGALDNGNPYSPLIETFTSSAEEAGITVGRDLSRGDPRGVSIVPVTVTASGKRCDAGRAWLLPNAGRPNLKVLVGQTVGKILFDESLEQPRAKGVEFGQHKAKVFRVYSRQEVILAAGALVSPLILEHSGIGLKHVLKAVGIGQLVDLPVGLNLQDQCNNHIRNQTTSEGAGQGQAAYFATFSEVFGDLQDEALAMLRNDDLLLRWAQETVTGGGFQNAEALLLHYKNYLDHIEKHDVAFSELLLDTWGEFNFSVWHLLPLGRGYVHVRDCDPYVKIADINPRLLTNQFDVLSQAATAKLARKMSGYGKMASFRDKELSPSFDLVPEDADISAWVSWVKTTYQTNLHAVGTCSMMKRELGGVVDYKARVYGTTGLRVIDASILPTQISSHMVATLYGVAEKIASTILEDYSNTNTNGR